MLGNDYFYNKSIRKYVIAFGMLFDDIHIRRAMPDGTYKDVKVPLHFTPQSKTYQFISHGIQNGYSLPRMSFDFSILGVDEDRKSSRTVGYLHKKNIDTANPLNSQIDVAAMSHVPVNLGFTLNTFSDDIEDGLQIVEQIIPYFQPSMTVKIKPLDNYPDFVVDCVVTLNDFEHDYDVLGDITEKDIYQWNLSFTLEGWFFSPARQELPVIEIHDNINIVEYFKGSEE